ncbi:hypothetical protein [Algoriphagus lutimaris]|uniref:hypothetical protein n=1 Tax=Algoriphagus lutimaris TaxID=613197 RepID=UPI001FAEA038|nr:hypothetical protein [Algoriphagus lutimaris]
MKINTKIVLSLIAVFLGIFGISLSFFPQEISFSLNLQADFFLFLQLMGALYFGYTMINWMVKGSTIGGIYNRPIAIGNFSHFAIGTLALIKYSSKALDQSQP